MRCLPIPSDLKSYQHKGQVILTMHRLRSWGPLKGVITLGGFLEGCTAHMEFLGSWSLLMGRVFRRFIFGVF